MRAAGNLTELIGNTPVLELQRIKKNHGLRANVFAKLEYFNPAGSAKDRIALAMVLKAEEDGILKEGGTIIEPTSGNTGIGLAAVAAAKGYRMILTMPESMSIERRKLAAAYGAEIVLTPASEGMQGAVNRAEELKKETPGSIVAGQFVNPANPEMHYKTTGPEIWEAMDGRVDAFVAGIGTGGTLSGVGKFLKEKNPEIKIIGAEPFSSPLLTEGKAGPHKIQGIGANFVPLTLDRNVYDEIITVKDEDAFSAAREIPKAEGVFVGISSGAALYAAMEIAKRPEFEGKNIVALFPDTGERYLSSPVFSAEDENK